MASPRSGPLAACHKPVPPCRMLRLPPDLTGAPTLMAGSPSHSAVSPVQRPPGTPVRGFEEAASSNNPVHWDWDHIIIMDYKFMHRLILQAAWRYSRFTADGCREICLRMGSDFDTTPRQGPSSIDPKAYRVKATLLHSGAPRFHSVQQTATISPGFPSVIECSSMTL